MILNLAGTDATEEYDPVHPPGLLEETLNASSCLGSIDAASQPKVSSEQVTTVVKRGTSARSNHQSYWTKFENEVDHVSDCLSLDEIEHLATSKLSEKAWAYYYSAGDDLASKHMNNLVYNQILLRPRIFVDCTRCDTSTQLLGQSLKVPFFVSPAAMARLAHPSGEHGIAQACSKYGALQIISNNASQTPEQIVADASPNQVFGWQLYVQDDRKKSEKMLARINKLKAIKFICLTLDAPVPGKRQHDERVKSVGANLPVSSKTAATQTDSSASERTANAAGGVGRALFAGTAADLTWDKTLFWLTTFTKLPIILKGVQTHEDAFMALRYTRRFPQLQGLLLSNHGGRAADTAPPSIHTLMEIRRYCPEVLTKMDVMVDGGIKRGTDVVKALALGAKAVGLGRAPLYGLGAGGVEGVERVFEILKGETETAMRLLGVEKTEELGVRHVNARVVEMEIYREPPGVQLEGRQKVLNLQPKL